MKSVRLLTALAALIVVGSTLGAPDAFAQRVHMVQTDCDTLSLDPPLVRVTFGVINRNPTPVCSFRITPVQVGPAPDDSCNVLECSNAPGWTCSLTPEGGAVWRIDPATPPGCIPLDGKHEPFDIILDPLFCCYRAEFFDESGNLIYEDEVCFECHKPVPTFRSTWGTLKAHYR